MYDETLLTQLAQTWPETTDYLRRVGQVTNDLQTIRELQQRDRYESSLTWLDQLEIDVEDLTQTPTAAQVLTFLYNREIVIRSASQIAEYQELRDEHELEQTENQNTLTDLLESTSLLLPAKLDARLWALPELQNNLIEWANETATRHGHQTLPLSLTQATILLNLCRFLEQEPEQSPAWAEACLQHALSSDFFEKTANPPRQS
jgi:hypothetical protein